MANIQYTRNRLSEDGLQYIKNLKTLKAWLRFAKFHPPKYIRKRMLIVGYDIRNKYDW